MSVKIPDKNLIHEFEKNTSLSPGFFGELYKEDDWSFIIKLSALFEAACTQVLTKALKKEELKDVLSRLDIANLQYGKLAFLSSLKIIDKHTERFVEKVASLRNAFVHNVSNTQSTLKEYLEAMEATARKEYLKHLTFYLPHDFALQKHNMSAAEYMVKQPVEAIYVASYFCLYYGILLKQDDIRFTELERK